ncbi:MAG: hypothetical protein HQM14_16290 [SAR324 cluster bacterium]|nr:hypothetical protein [SAR324 cluster bacterium]
MNLNKDELLKQYKTNSVYKYGIMGVFLFLAYVLPGGMNLIFAAAGLGLGYLAYNDHVDVDEPV